MTSTTKRISFNHTIFSNPNTTRTSGSFGTISGVNLQPRNIQVSGLAGEPASEWTFFLAAQLAPNSHSRYYQSELPND